MVLPEREGFMSALRASVRSPSSGSLRNSLHMDVRVS